MGLKEITILILRRRPCLKQTHFNFDHNDHHDGDGGDHHGDGDYDGGEDLK